MMIALIIIIVSIAIFGGMFFLVHQAPSPEDTSTNSTQVNDTQQIESNVDKNTQDIEKITYVPGFDFSKADVDTVANIHNLAMIASNLDNSSSSYNDTVVSIHNLELGWVATNNN